MLRRFAAARRLAPSAWVVALVLGMAGCNGDGKPDLPLTPVTGKVTLGDAPLAEAVLEFIPVGATGGQGGSAITKADGSYLAITAFGDQGLPAGDYQVVISKQEFPKGAAPPDKDATRATSPFREVLPPVYSNRARSNLKAKVSPGAESINNFELKPDKRTASR
jgi:hypothetical protein